MPRKKKKTTQLLPLISMIVSGLLVVAFVAFGIVSQERKQAAEEIIQQEEAQEVSELQKTHMLVRDLLSELSIEAKQVLVFDIQNQEMIYGRQELEQGNLASLAKIFTARALHGLPLREVCITAEDLELVGDQGLAEEECYLSNQATAAMLVSSSNDLVAALDRSYEGALQESLDAYIATNVLSVALGHPSGWDFGEGDKQSLGAPVDVMHAMIDLAAVAPEIARATTFPVYQLGEHELAHTYPDVATTSRIEFLKTGYTDLAGGNMAAIIEPTNEQQIGVVLMGSSFEGRFVDFQNIISIVDTVYRFFEVS